MNAPVAKSVAAAADTAADLTRMLNSSDSTTQNTPAQLALNASMKTHMHSKDPNASPAS